MNELALIIRPTAVFSAPFRVLAGQIVMSPRIIPFGQELHLFLADGRVKTVVLNSEITTSPEAMAQNLHGFTYSGDVIEAQDLTGDVVLTNLSCDEARRAYRQAVGGAVS